MYESKHRKPLTRRQFALRMVRHVCVALGLISIALGIGVLGYHYFAGLDWIDALLDASMILGGMGPVHSLDSTAAKIFASLYALFSGLAFLAIAGVMIAPFVHRMLHRFHWEESGDG